VVSLVGVPTLHLKDPEVHRLAAELARRRGTSMTAAVRSALQDAVEAMERDRDDMVERILEVSRRSAELEAPFLTDADLYDDQGLPR